jgi:probable addiction module antidote protein
MDHPVTWSRDFIHLGLGFEAALSLKVALKDVADARLGGMSALSKKTELNREQLYKTLSKNGNPRLDTLSEVLHAVELRVAVAPDARLL